MKKIAVFTSGGDAPGMNACIRSVVRSAIYLDIEIYAIKYGYDGLIYGDIERINTYAVSNIVQTGGTILKSARSQEFRTIEGRTLAFKNLTKHGIEGLVAIGGDGTFTGINLFYNEFGIPVVGVPATIDNDLYGSDYTIGFDTAVNTAIEAIDKIRDTAASHDRVFFIEVMGKHSGYIAIQSGIGGGAEIVMVPETSTTIQDVIYKLKEGRDNNKTSSIVVVAEGDQQGNAFQIAEKVKKETPKMDIRVSNIGYIQRGGAPTAFDRVLAARLGLAAVEGLLHGEKNVMVGVVNKKITYTQLEEAISKTKPLNQELIRLTGILSQ